MIDADRPDPRLAATAARIDRLAENVRRLRDHETTSLDAPSDMGLHNAVENEMLDTASCIETAGSVGC